MRSDARFPTLARFFLVACSSFVVICAASYNKPRSCNEHDRRALLEFKRSISLNESASSGPLAYPKTARWGANEPRANGTDCCSWDGVECDEESGRVVGLDLSSSFLYGPIDSTSSLFRLLRLRMLDLSHNDFVHSQIPAAVGRLSHLEYLNLSYSAFGGQIPMVVISANLTRLTSLDLSYNPLMLHHPSFRNLVRNLTVLQDLSLSMVDISSKVPDVLANFTSLRSILLHDCRLSGEFPAGIFRLPKLRLLSVQNNPNLTGSLPEFPKGSPLQILRLSYTNFSGSIPKSIQNLQSLTYLDLADCSFYGSLPASLNNLTRLTDLNLRNNKFTGLFPYLGSLSRLEVLFFSSKYFERWNLPEWLGRLAELRGIYIFESKLSGEIPRSLENLTRLNDLSLPHNHLTGHIPSWLTNMTQLDSIEISFNQLQGPLPQSVKHLENLELLDISYNNLSGTVEIDNFRNLTKLTGLQLGGNWINLVTKSTTKNHTFPKLSYLDLGMCNLNKFPEFLRYQDELEMLNMNTNQIHGPVPEWLWNGTRGLTVLSLSNNLLTGFEHSPIILPWSNIQLLDLSNNMLEGSLPIPPPSTLLYQISNNNLTGEIPLQICLRSALFYFDISNNSLSGTIPPCLGNFSNSLNVLSLGGNSLSGAIPNTFAEGSNLKMIDFSRNQLVGPLPASLAKCSLLQILVLNDNRLEGLFPSWLGILPELQVLDSWDHNVHQLLLMKRGGQVIYAGRFNKLHGSLTTPSSGVHFPNLRIMDLSHNALTGDVPEGYFHGWNAMKTAFVESSDYLNSDKFFRVSGQSFFVGWPYSITITNKGVKTEYVRILTIFASLDLSGNKFEGQIPESIRQLLGLESLNLSDNHLTGQIPSSLQNLRNLEALDLSQNTLSGEIPKPLAELSFLAFINVSYNNLTGPIPQGQQFYTFSNASYKGNPGLCGEPLSRKCSETSSTPSPIVEEDDDSDFPSGVADWIVIFAGFGSGLVVGIVFGQQITRRYHRWFVSKFGRKKKSPRIRIQRERGN